MPSCCIGVRPPNVASNFRRDSHITHPHPSSSRRARTKTSTIVTNGTAHVKISKSGRRGSARRAELKSFCPTTQPCQMPHLSPSPALACSTSHRALLRLSRTNCQASRVELAGWLPDSPYWCDRRDEMSETSSTHRARMKRRCSTTSALAHTFSAAEIRTSHHRELVLMQATQTPSLSLYTFPTSPALTGTACTSARPSPPPHRPSDSTTPRPSYDP